VDYDFSDPAMKKVMIYTPITYQMLPWMKNSNQRRIIDFYYLFIDQPQLSSVASQWKWTPP